MNRDQLILKMKSVIASDKCMSIAYVSYDERAQTIATAKIRNEIADDAVVSIMNLVDQYSNKRLELQARIRELNSLQRHWHDMDGDLLLVVEERLASLHRELRSL